MIDYRCLNLHTKLYSNLIPKTQECLDSLAGAKVFTTMDSPAAYHQIPVKEADIPKTAFITKFGLHEWVVMPMGLLQNLQWQKCVIYLDDVIVFGKNFDEHLEMVQEVLQHFWEAGLKLKPSKCHFFQREVKFLGFHVSADGIKPLDDNVNKVVEWLKTRNQTDVQAFLGLSNYYKRFIRHYSQKGQPLICLTRQDVPFNWTDNWQKVFDQLKQELTNSSIMAHPKLKG